MKILMLKWDNICERQMIRAFKSLGVEIDFYTYPSHNVDYDKAALDEMTELFMNHMGEYQYIYSVDYFPLVARIANVVKIPYISWSVDCPVFPYYSKTLSLPYNRVFLFDYAMFNEFAPMNPEHTYYLPLAVDQPHYDEAIATIIEADRKRFSSDISFVGSLYTEKCDFDKVNNLSDYAKGYANALIEAQLKVYGYNFLTEAMSPEFVNEFTKAVGDGKVNEDYVLDSATMIAQMFIGEKVTQVERVRLLNYLSEYFNVDMYSLSDMSVLPKVNYKGTAESTMDMPKVFHLSKINLNMTSKTIRTGLPQRAWDILAAGGFMLTNYQEELPEFFTPGVEVETYGSFEECRDKIAYYLEHEDERKEIARRGYEKAKELHDYRRRISQMFDILKSDR